MSKGEEGSPWLCISISDKLPTSIQLAVDALWGYESSIDKLNLLKITKSHLDDEIARLENLEHEQT